MKILIIGFGISGKAAAKFALNQEYKVFVYDDNKETYKNNEIKNNNNIFYIYEFNESYLNNIDFVIVSPGINKNNRVLKLCEEKKIKIFSEMEYAYSFLKGNKLIAVTGTNGKTTTVKLISHILSYNKIDNITVGNVGLPLSSALDKINSDTVIICEISSYQCDRIINFRPDLAVILNVTPDHLEYHGSFEHYFNSKWKISFNQNENNLLILNADDNNLLLSSQHKESIFGGEKKKVDSKILKISLQNISERGAYLDNSNLIYDDGKHKEEIMSIEDIPLYGQHNIYNTLAATIAAKYLEIHNEDIRDAVKSFTGVEHRLENVKLNTKKRFINDSKSTNINSAWYALNSFDKKVIWIAGGMYSSNDYSIIEQSVINKVKKIICFGQENERIFDYFKDFVLIEKVDKLEDAIKLSIFETNDDDIILFSPACKSFDSFINYEHRGEFFKNTLKNIFS